MAALTRTTVEKLSRDLIGLIQLARGSPRRTGTLGHELAAKGISPAIAVERGAGPVFANRCETGYPARAPAKVLHQGPPMAAYSLPHQTRGQSDCRLWV